VLDAIRAKCDAEVTKELEVWKARGASGGPTPKSADIDRTLPMFAAQARAKNARCIASDDPRLAK
jgi:hypothetical protein